MEMDRGVMPGPMPPAGLVAAPPRAANRARRQIVQPAVQRLRSAVDDVWTLDFAAKIPPGEAGGFVRLQRRRPILRPSQNSRVLDAAVQVRAVGVVIRAQSGSGRGAEYNRTNRVQRTGDFGFAGSVDAPAALQCGWAQPHPAGF